MISIKQHIIIAAVAIVSISAARSPAAQDGSSGDTAVIRPAKSEFAGTVVETMNAARYTYVLIDTGKEKIWAAAPQFPVKVGDKVAVPQGVPMSNYQSKTLNRTFDTVYFADRIVKPGLEQPASSTVQEAHANLKNRAGSPQAPVTDFSGIKKAPGGVTVAELFAQKSALAKNKVVVRGKVVKFNPQIMGKNWIHLQDGTGNKGSNDVTVTTSDKVKVGDTVLVNGTLALDKDFGYGYKYEVLLENAKLTVE